MITPVGCHSHYWITSSEHTPLYADLHMPYIHMVQAKPKNTYDTIAYTG